MECAEQDDVIRLDELMQRTSDFITYFELAESNMLSWKESIIEQSTAHKQQFTEQMNALQQKIDAINELLTHAGLNEFHSKMQEDLKITLDDTMNQIKEHSCEQVEKSAQNAIQKSEKLLRLFQWRSIVLILFTTLITTVTTGLYINDEFPWDFHRQATNERSAGKILMKAWPVLSQEEREKVLGIK